jgi:hypothetical protein
MALAPLPIGEGSNDKIKDTPTGPVHGKYVKGRKAPVINSFKKGDGFISKKDQDRLDKYIHFEHLFYGRHREAYAEKISDHYYNKTYGTLKYIAANFAGLLSKIVADMLFSEGVQIKMPDGGDQEFMDALVRENKLDIQFYESALSNSYFGDALFKLRIGKRNPMRDDENETLIIEDMTPTVYFPGIDQFNVRQNPQIKELAWKFKIGEDDYVRKEIHIPGFIINELWKMKDGKIDTQEDLSLLGIPGLMDVQETKINDSLLVHVPNWKTGRTYWGISDYNDLDTIFYAINNRLTKVDNILDKHSDPILFVPEGIIGDDGKVRREALGMIEFPTGTGGDEKPEYITWNASLDSAFNEVDKLIEILFMTSETSPDILGMGKGQSDSGRALKLKILRTIAKITRKKLYYNRAIQELLLTAQKLAKAWNIEIGGVKMTGEPQIPEIVWSDGLPIDELEQVEIEGMRLDDGTQTTVEAIQKIDQIDEEAAEEKAKAVREEKKLDIPPVNISGNPFSKKGVEDGDASN